MKKLIATVLVAGLLAAGIGCGGGKTEVKKSTSSDGGGAKTKESTSK